MLSYKALVALLIALFVTWLQRPWFCALILLTVTVGYLLTGGWGVARLVYLTFSRDWSFLLLVLKAKWASARNRRHGKILPILFQEVVARFPHKTAFIFEGQKWTYQQVEDYSNKVANYFKAAGYKKGDVVALFAENSPEYVGIWLGLAKIGVITSLINSNLRLESLVHCISVASVKALIFSLDLSGAVKDILGQLGDIDIYCMDETDVLEAEDFSKVLENNSSTPPPMLEGRSTSDVLFYIYTSGTTGWPKAASVRHDKIVEGSKIPSISFKMSEKDVVYVALPLYHTAATMLGVVPSILTGCTCIIRKRFSASNFFKDCVEHNVTVTQYIGEICRYLLAQPVGEWDQRHKVRAIHGNGMRPHVWKQFQERFRIPMILEFYGATEGSFAFVNMDGHIGSVGFIPFIYLPPKLIPFDLVQVDENLEIKRGPDGVGIRCAAGEPGMAVGKLLKGTVNNFYGYVNNNAQSSKKVGHDVLTRGDSVFISGDIMVRDELGYLYFKDRVGDTFRWKGENVSTAEVESTIMKLIGQADVIVYGVEVPGAEGRAGMAAICDPERNIDLKVLGCDLKKTLPSYARPLFLRICDKVELTGTFKLKKVKMRQEAFDPAVIADKLFYFDQKSAQFLPLDQSVYDQIADGSLKM